MRDYQTKANQGGAPDSITSTKLGAGETNSFLTEAKTAVSRAGLTVADADGAGEDTTQLAQALFINAVKASSFLDSGSANSYQLTPVSGSSGVLLPGGYGALDGMKIYFVPSADNTGNTTINVGQTVGTLLGSKKALTLAGGEIPSGALLASRLASFTYDASADSGTGAWILDGSYDASGQFLPLTGGTMTGPIAMGNNKVTGLADGVASGDAVTKRQLDAAVPTGAVFHFAANTAPDGYLECNGTAVSRTTYAALFSVVGTTFGAGDGATTFNLPDLRGEFIRGWDNGREVDTARAFGSSQADELKSHTHTTDSYSLGGYGGTTSFGTFATAPNGNKATNATGGTETRPRNIALLACIKT